MDALTLDELVDLAAHDPAAATRSITARLAAEPTPAERAGLYLARGVAARAGNDVRSALADLRRAIAIAERHDHRRLAARARVSLSAALAYDGDIAGALRTCRMAIPQRRGRDRLAATATEAGLLVRSGRMVEADAALTVALRSARRLHDDDWAGRILNNRSIVRAERGDTRGAQRDLDAAEHCFTSVDAQLDLVDVTANRAWIAGLTGDLPTAIRLSEQAEAAFRRMDVADAAATVAADRALALLRGGLIDEAERTARHAARQLDAQQMTIDADECRLIAAEAALAAGRADEGLADLSGVTAPHRATWIDRTTVLAARLELAGADADVDAGLLRRVRRAARRLEDRELTVDAIDAHLLAADVAERTGGRQRNDLVRAAANPSHRRLPASATIGRSIATARLALLDDDTTAAQRAVRRGMRVLADHRLAIGGEAALAAAHAGRELERLAALIAATTGRPRPLVDAIESSRIGGEGRLLSAESRQHPDIAELLADVRRHHHPQTGDHRALARAERTLRLRLLAGERPGDRRVSMPHWRAALEGRTAIVFADDGTNAMAAVIGTGSARLVPLGPVDGLRRNAQHLRHVLGHAARSGDPTVATDALDRVGSSFTAALADTSPTGVVVVPSAGWNQVCWSLLPRLRGVPVSVVPSLRTLAVTCRSWSSAPIERVVAAHGPRLAHAPDEVARVIEVWDGRASSTSGAELLSTMQRVDVVHAACHGQVRSDSPLFSSLEIGDGTVAWHDLVALDPLPRVLVLAACDVGAAASTAADVPIGGPAALLASGAASVIAAMGPVNDAASVDVIVELHRRLAAGVRPAVALADVPTSALVPLVAFGC